MEYLKMGIKANPPSMVLFYSFNQKLRKKIIPLKRFSSHTNIDLEAERIILRHDVLIPKATIKKFLRLIQELNKGVAKKEALKIIEAELEHGNISKLGLLKNQEHELNTLFNIQQSAKNESTSEDEIDLPEQNDSFWDQNNKDDEI